MSQDLFDADVVVIGAGIMGATVAWRLSAVGLNVIAVDKAYPGNELGASGGDTRLFRLLYHEGPDYIASLQNAFQLWRDLEATTGETLFHSTGGLMLAPREHPGIVSILEGAAQYDLPHATWSVDTVRERFPQVSSLTDEIGVWDPASGVLRANRSVMAAGQAALQGGASFLPDVNASAVDSDASGVTVRTTQGPLRARWIVVAAGPWTAQLLPDLQDVVRTRRMVAAWFAPQSAAEYSGERFPVVWRRGHWNMSAIPAVTGEDVKVNGHLAETSITHSDPDCVDRTVHPSDIAPLSAAAEGALNRLLPGPVRHAVYHDTYTTDRRAIIDFVDPHDRILVTTGFSGHGFKLAPAFAEMITDRITDRTSAERLAPYALRRRSLSRVRA